MCADIDEKEIYFDGSERFEMEMEGCGSLFVRKEVTEKDFHNFSTR